MSSLLATTLLRGLFLAGLDRAGSIVAVSGAVITISIIPVVPVIIVVITIIAVTVPITGTFVRDFETVLSEDSGRVELRTFDIIIVDAAVLVQIVLGIALLLRLGFIAVARLGLATLLDFLLTLLTAASRRCTVAVSGSVVTIALTGTISIASAVVAITSTVSVTGAVTRSRAIVAVSITFGGSFDVILIEDALELVGQRGVATITVTVSVPSTISITGSSPVVSVTGTIAGSVAAVSLAFATLFQLLLFFLRAGVAPSPSSGGFSS